MAKSTPGTAGSKGGGNVVPSTRFPTRGGVLRSQIPAGRGTVPDNYDYGRNMPRRFPMPSPGTGTIFLPPTQNPRRNPFPGGYNDRFNRFPSQQPRYPMPRNPYSQPPSRYGRMQGPTGLGGFLSRQPAISQRQIDPATGFPTQYQIQQDRAEADAQAERDYIAQEAEADARETARQKEEERKRYQPGGSMSRTPVNPTRSSGKGGSKGGASTVNPSRPDNVQVSDVFMEGVENAHLLGNNAPQAREGQLARFPGLTAPPSPTFGNNPPPSPVRQYTGSPNIRPAMNVGKATGGPVGLASLIGRY